MKKYILLASLVSVSISRALEKKEADCCDVIHRCEEGRVSYDSQTNSIVASHAEEGKNGTIETTVIKYRGSKPRFDIAAITYHPSGVIVSDTPYNRKIIKMLKNNIEIFEKYHMNTD